ncbi:hypothetical protein [Sphingobacterium cellulitidis]|uniref:hypothetical protein n=1 Tax=Sphingobacterium cellulitidis TaxID=1768011 RepID=UPI003C7D7181
MRRQIISIQSLTILLFAVLFTLSSCKKDKHPDDSDEPDEFEELYKGLKVHAFGQIQKEGDPLGSRPVHWFNGEINYLEGSENGGSVLDAFMLGQDIYVTGFEGAVGSDVTSRKLVYWVNGKKHVLEQNVFATGNMIYVSKSKDIYIKRTVYENNKVSSTDILKNGKIWPLEIRNNKKPDIREFRGMNNDVYVLGHMENSTLWKNGKIHMEKKYPETMQNVIFHQNDTYLFLINLLNRNNKEPYITIHKNNKLYQSIAKTNDVNWVDVGNIRTFMEGSTTYVAVSFRNESNAKIVVWKDGKKHLDLPANEMMLENLFVKNGHVFVSAYNAEDQEKSDKYWMDNKELILDSDDAKEINISKIIIEEAQ